MYLFFLLDWCIYIHVFVLSVGLVYLCFLLVSLVYLYLFSVGFNGVFVSLVAKLGLTTCTCMYMFRAF